MTPTAPVPTPVTPRQADALALAAVAAGDQAAFTRLYREHRNRVWRVAYGILLNREDASDVVQETFLKLHQVSAQWRPDALVSTWLYRVCVNQALSSRRKLAGFARNVGRVLAARTPESHALQDEALRLVEGTLAGMNARQRAAVSLLLEAELAPSEIAPLLGLTPNATRVMLHRALTVIRTQLRAHGIESAPLPDERTLLEEAE